MYYQGNNNLFHLVEYIWNIHMYIWFKIKFFYFYSTKKGKLLSVSKELPAKCAFKDYDQLRRHWKNMV